MRGANLFPEFNTLIKGKFMPQEWPLLVASGFSWLALQKGVAHAKAKSFTGSLRYE